ncbi:phosphate-starvation-inducible protein PsiE [Acidihalobacter ferrooxydans]|uniref:phosphate-starvation-inducible protein PsiE n=1 Tax=Acidihalobacter ferrooxydans TaxID=1765967 RepID=UPI0018DE0141|nr:phosphate-starvation-inducible PsiE family protein [Acidihalobacter ferrooxydans]
MASKVKVGFKRAERAGNMLVEFFQSFSLFIIGASIIWSAGLFYLHLIQLGRASLEDLLLLFVYLELGAMTGIYFRTKHLPVRFLIYIAITAIARYLIVDIDHIKPMSVLVMSVSIAVLTVALWIEHRVVDMGVASEDESSP